MNDAEFVGVGGVSANCGSWQNDWDQRPAGTTGAENLRKTLYSGDRKGRGFPKASRDLDLVLRLEWCSRMT